MGQKEEAVGQIEEATPKGRRQAATPPPGERRADAVSPGGLPTALTHPWRLVPELPVPALEALPGYTRLQVQLLHNRGLRDAAAVDAWLGRDWRAASNPSADPSTPPLPNLEAAVAIIRRALDRRERIVVFGDFDADGITSCAVLVLALRALGADVSPYIPHPSVAGRGPSEAALRELHTQGTQLVITTDSGTTNVAEIALANTLGMTVIVTDHHAPEGPLAPAAAIVNPRLAEAPIADGELAGVGVAFRLAEALLADAPGGPARLEALLDLVAVGTIADIVPLSAANWALVRAGLERLNTRPRAGLRALVAQIGLVVGELHEGDISYRLAPRLNAGQRMGEPRVALDLLLVEDPAEAERLAARLAALNSERQRKTDELLAEADAQLRARPLAPVAPLIVVRGRGWPLGMLGLVAGRLADEHKRPALALGQEGEFWRGSLRAPDGVSMVTALGASGELLAYFGGHARAAGFTVSAANLEPLLARLRAYLAAASQRDRTSSADAGTTGAPAADALLVDCRLPLTKATPEKYREVRALGPFGPGFPPPLFLARGTRIVRCFAAGPGQRHLRLVLRDATAQRLASWPNHGRYADALARALPTLPPLDVIYSFDPFFVSGAAEYVCVEALSLPA
jgi:single-stranded-DNA-specific exonuclease